MPDYANGKIYKITSGDLTYIGSTCEPTLARRLSGHVTNYKRWKDGKVHKITTSFQLIDTGDYEITLVELCPCGSKDELTARERYWIETIPCVNKSIPGRTDKEYRETHKEQINEYNKTYDNDHKEQIKERKQIYYQANKERIDQRTATYFQNNREKTNERARIYNQANREKRNEGQRRRRAEKSKLILE